MRRLGAAECVTVEFTRFTAFHVLWLIAVPFGAATGWWTARGYGIVSAIAGATAAAVAVHVLWLMLLDWIDHYFLKQLSESTNEELRAVIAEPDWKFWHSMALLNLAARNEDVRCELPRVLAMLESDSKLTRAYGWDALRLVFSEETRLMGDYDPRASTENCRERAVALRAAIGQA